MPRTGRGPARVTGLAAALAGGAVLLAGAAPASAGPFRLPEVVGRVVARESGLPVPGATVVEWQRALRGASDARPVLVARVARTDAEGRFTLPAQRVWSPRVWLARSEGPTYGVWAPAFGFQRPPESDLAGERRLPLAPVDETARRASLAPLCESAASDEGTRRLAEAACPRGAPRHARPD